MLILPFIFLLLSIAFFPLLAANLWHRFEKFIICCIMIGAVVVCTYHDQGCDRSTIRLFTEELFYHYAPFLALITTLYIIGSGIHIDIKAKPTTAANCLFFFTGSFLSSMIGTTGASIILIKPFLSMNAKRCQKTHLVVFFIMMIANIGGCLTPLGDPPLFLGFLQGVPFFWPTIKLFIPFLMTSGLLLMLFFVIDQWIIRQEPKEATSNNPFFLSIKGKNFFILLAFLLSIIIASSFISNHFYATSFQILSMGAMSLVGLHWLKKNDSILMDWGPVKEIAFIFFAIFVTLVPANIYLENPQNIILKGIDLGAAGMPNPLSYYLGTGLLSAFLDNAPTYLMFFKLAGGDVDTLTTIQSKVLQAISMGAVFWGAMSYIGNAPNLLIRNLAAAHHVAMPTFLGYLAYSILILLPVLLVVGWIFF
jgi:Na+/H+ antiporter NhaD/arsenite permease-like protein